MAMDGVRILGADVFDVYSLAPGLGINGVAYKDW